VVIGFRGKSGAKVRDMAAVQRYLEALRSTKGGSPSPASSPPSSPRPLRSQSPVETNEYRLNKWKRVFNTREKVIGYVSPGGSILYIINHLKRGKMVIHMMTMKMLEAQILMVIDTY
jgi:hypothetical protein